MIGWSDQPKSAPLPPLATVLQTTTSFIFVSTEARNKNNIMIVFMTHCLSDSIADSVNQKCFQIPRWSKLLRVCPTSVLLPFKEPSWEIYTREICSWSFTQECYPNLQSLEQPKAKNLGKATGSNLKNCPL